LIIDDISMAEGDAPGTTAFTFTVSIDPAGTGTTSVEDLTVVANASGVTAMSGGVDFDDLVNQLLTISAGETSTTVTVNVTRDNLAEVDETFELNLSDAQFNGGTDTTRVVIGDPTGLGTIENDDFVPVAHAGGPYVIDEGMGVTLDASASTDDDVPADTLTYRWDVDDDGDFDENVTGVMPSLTWAQLVALGIDDGPYLGDVTVEVSDGTNVDTDTTTLQVDNVSPTAEPDSFATDVFTLVVGNVLLDNGNGADSDPAGPVADPLVVSQADSANAAQVPVAVVSGGTTITTELGGTVVINPDGTFTYNATTSGTLLGLAEGATLDDTFTYEISDGDGGFDTATVTITVTAASENSVHIIDCPCGGGTKAIVVRGSSTADDKIDIKPGSEPDTIEVKIKGSMGPIGSMGSMGSIGGSVGSMGPMAGETSPTGSFRFEVPSANVSKVIVYGLDGNDDIKVHSNTNVNAWLFGGGGDDKLRGGDLADVLIGGDGDDQIDGKDGRDLLIGGDGADKLKGHKDEDILVAATTLYDDNLAALCGIHQEWNSSNSLEDRVNNIFDGSGASGANGLFFLDSSTVQVSDGDEDELQGGSGSDWFIADEDSDGDKLKDFDDEDIFGLDAGWFDVDP
jgi:VCBS repeat-containing protein